MIFTNWWVTLIGLTCFWGGIYSKRLRVWNGFHHQPFNQAPVKLKRLSPIWAKHQADKRGCDVEEVHQVDFWKSHHLKSTGWTGSCQVPVVVRCVEGFFLGCWSNFPCFCSLFNSSMHRVFSKDSRERSGGICHCWHLLRWTFFRYGVDVVVMIGLTKKLPEQLCSGVPDDGHSEKKLVVSSAKLLILIFYSSIPSGFFFSSIFSIRSWEDEPSEILTSGLELGLLGQLISGLGREVNPVPAVVTWNIWISGNCLVVILARNFDVLSLIESQVVDIGGACWVRSPWISFLFCMILLSKPGMKEASCDPS